MSFLQRLLKIIDGLLSKEPLGDSKQVTTLLSSVEEALKLIGPLLNDRQTSMMSKFVGKSPSCRPTVIQRSHTVFFFHGRKQETELFSLSSLWLIFVVIGPTPMASTALRNAARYLITKPKLMSNSNKYFT